MSSISRQSGRLPREDQITNPDHSALVLGRDVELRRIGEPVSLGDRREVDGVQDWLVRADTSDSWWAGSWLRAGGHQISGSVDTISSHDTLVVNDGRGSFGWVGLVCHANQLIRKEPRGEVCQGSDGDLGGLRPDPVRAFGGAAGRV